MARLFLKWMYHHLICQILQIKEVHTVDKESLGFISNNAGSSQKVRPDTSLLIKVAKAKLFLKEEEEEEKKAHQGNLAPVDVKLSSELFIARYHRFHFLTAS